MTDHATAHILDLPEFRSQKRLPFVETFGPTIQGEGSAAGRLSSFLRFGGCNLACSWCDSAYTWDADRYSLRDEIQMLTVREIVERVPGPPGLLIVTGGEPLLNQRNPAFVELLGALKGAGWELHVETNGTIVPNADLCGLIDLFNVSPKLPHADAQKKRHMPALAPGWAALHDTINADMKVVVMDEEDVAAAAKWAADVGWPAGKVWVMPEGVTADTLNRRWPLVCEWATKYHLNATHRLHVLSWGEERGH